ncbi:MAG: biotin synthase BioB [Planctomycetes bacterium]|nr:biotin synthase BioB [Planctomycetota bacterium]
MNGTIRQFGEKVVDGGILDRTEAEKLSALSKDHLQDVLYFANRIREKFFGNEIRVCSIVAGRLGGCDQDCAFCAQSVRHNTRIGKSVTVLTDDEILNAAKEAKEKGVPHFGIVYSGRAITEKELARIEKLIAKIKSEYGMGVCASLGIISADQARRLAKAGAERYNHNLETSERYFSKIVTTHNYSERVATITTALDAGLKVCGGGIFGIGESEADRLDMAFQLRELGVDMVPMNFLHPIEGTPLGHSKELEPMEILRIIAMYRFILPKANLKVAGGRVLNLRDLQSWIFTAGATSILTGNYLTTAGRSAEEDMQMLADLGLKIKRD